MRRAPGLAAVGRDREGRPRSAGPRGWWALRSGDFGECGLDVIGGGEFRARERRRATHPGWTISNQSVSGDTTADGFRRIDTAR
jgi:hypothetical protein